MKKLRILLLRHRPPARNAQTIVDHVLSFRRYSRHDVITVSLPQMFGSLPSLLDMAQFDVVVLHYTVVAALDTYLNPVAKEQIARFDGLKVQFIQDEYRFVNATVEATRRLGIHVLFTCVPDGEVEKVYPSAVLPDTRKVSVLTGYVPHRLVDLETPRIASRRIDIGYRSRKVPYWLGSLGAEKWRIAEAFLGATQNSGLVCDISCDEASRIYGRKWVRFLTSCKATLGVESGASVFDFTGEISRNVAAYVKANPDASFEAVRDLFFAAEEGKIRLNQISPRCFEAAALRTGMVLLEGEYSGILEPWKHYIPLRKDFSNIDSVVEQLRDPTSLQERVDRVFEEIALNPNYSYAGFVRRFDDVVEEEFATRIAPWRKSRHGSTGAPHWRAIIPIYASVSYFIKTMTYVVHPLISRIWIMLPEPIRERIRPLIRLLWVRS